MIKPIALVTGYRDGYPVVQPTDCAAVLPTGRALYDHPPAADVAELIVAECIGIIDELVKRNTDGTWVTTELYTDYNGALYEVKRRIEEHFGIEK